MVGNSCCGGSYLSPGGSFKNLIHSILHEGQNTTVCEHVVSHCQYRSYVNALNWD